MSARAWGNGIVLSVLIWAYIVVGVTALVR